MNEVLKNWIEIKLEKICSRITKGGTPTTYGYAFQKEGINFIKVENLNKGTVDLRSISDFISQEAHDFQKKSQLQEGDLLFSIAGTIGETCIVKKEILPANTNQALAIIQGFHKVLTPNFLKFQLDSFVARKVTSKARGGAMNNVSLGDLKNLDVLIPPVPEQRAIVAKIEQLFSELDNGIANLKAAKDKLEIYRQAVLKKAFEGELTKEWRKQNPYSEKDLVELLEYIEDFNSNKSGQDIPRRLPPIDLNDLHELPYGWIWQEAHKICSSVRDGTHDTPKYVDEGVPLVTSKNLKNGLIDMENVDLISDADHEEICKRSAVEENDILYGMIGTIGNPVIVKQTNAFSIKNVGLFKKNETLLIPKYFQYYLSSWVVEHIMRQKELIRGTTQKFVALGGLRVLPIPLPSKKEQEQIIYEIESRLSVCNNILTNIEEGLDKSEALRQSILKQAFEGKLLSEEELESCKQEPDWEPAEKLLERIKNRKLAEA